MANKVTNEDVININKLYLKMGTYAAVARELGFSAGTVKKYIIPGFKYIDESDVKPFDPSTLKDFDPSEFDDVEDFGDICGLSDEEVAEVHDLWKELII